MNPGIAFAGIFATILYSSPGDPLHGTGVNLFPNPGFDDFDADLPRGWSSQIWNQPMVNEKIHRLSPGRDGEGSCLEFKATTPIASTSISSPAFRVLPNQDYLFKGYYASTCQGTTIDKRWMNAEGVALSGNWLDAEKETIVSFTIPLPDTQDRWIEFYQEVRSPELAEQLQVVIIRRWVGGRLRFDDFSLREGNIMDYEEEFSIQQVSDEDFFPIYAILPPSERQEEPGSNIDSDLHHSQYALANFNLGVRAKNGKAPGFGVKYFQEGGLPEDDLRLSAMDQDPKLWWFFGVDEPHEDAFPHLAALNERVKRLAPSKTFWVNLLPTYGFGSLDEYDRHIKAYIEIVKPKVLTYDHYCMLGHDQQIHVDSWYNPNREGDYFPNLEIVRNRTLKAKIEFGVIVSVGVFMGIRGASEAELRWQAFTTLAYGARSLGWFTYLTESSYDHMTSWEDMVINRDGTRTRHYAMLKHLNGEVLAWGPTLLRLRSTGVYHTEPLPVMTQSIEGSALLESISGGMCLVGEFKAQHDGRYLMVVNRDFIEPATLELKFRRAPENLLEISKHTGNEQPVTDYSSVRSELKLELAAGDGSLFRLEQ